MCSSLRDNSSKVRRPSILVLSRATSAALKAENLESSEEAVESGGEELKLDEKIGSELSWTNNTCVVTTETAESDGFDGVNGTEPATKSDRLEAVTSGAVTAAEILEIDKTDVVSVGVESVALLMGGASNGGT